MRTLTLSHLFVLTLVVLGSAGCGKSDDSDGGSSNTGPSFLDSNALFATACFGVANQDFTESAGDSIFGMKHAVKTGQKMLPRVIGYLPESYRIAVSNSAETGADEVRVNATYLDVDCPAAAYTVAIAILRDATLFTDDTYATEACKLVKDTVVSGASSSSAGSGHSGDKYELSMTFSGTPIGECPVDQTLYMPGEAETIAYSGGSEVDALHPFVQFYTHL